MYTTAQDHIIAAFRRCGNQRPGYVPQAELLTEALNEWNLLFDDWQTERNMGFSIPTEVYTITGLGSQNNDNGYTIGPGGDFNGPRPESIVRANLRFAGSNPPVYIPLQPISVEQWARLAVRQINAGTITNMFYYDPQFPLGVFNVYPQLTSGAIELFQWQVLTVPATLGTTYTAPPGYRNAVIWSLAERLYPLVNHDMAIHKLSQEYVAGAAYEARQKLAWLNRRVVPMACEFGAGGTREGFFDWGPTFTGLPT